MSNVETHTIGHYESKRLKGLALQGVSEFLRGHAMNLMDGRRIDSISIHGLEAPVPEEGAA